jgi:hypothetical protein
VFYNLEHRVFLTFRGIAGEKTPARRPIMNSRASNSLPRRLQLRRGTAFGIIIIGALVAFEIFNYSTTDFALHDLLGDLSFVGLRWSTILAIAFCGIDFAGIARIFTPEEGVNEPMEIWYLFGAWLLAATMNAMLTWWGVSIAIVEHETLGNAVVARATLLKVVPIFVASLVWLSRVLLISTFSIAGERLFSQRDVPSLRPAAQVENKARPVRNRSYPTPAPAPQAAFRPSAARPARAAEPTAPRASASRQVEEPVYEPVYSPRPEPSYHPVSLQGHSRNSGTRS